MFGLFEHFFRVSSMFKPTVISKKKLKDQLCNHNQLGTLNFSKEVFQLQGVLAYHGFWGKQKIVISKIRDKQGLLSKTLKMGENDFQSQYFGYFAFKMPNVDAEII